MIIPAYTRNDDDGAGKGLSMVRLDPLSRKVAWSVVLDMETDDGYTLALSTCDATAPADATVPAKDPLILAWETNISYASYAVNLTVFNAATGDAVWNVPGIQGGGQCMYSQSRHFRTSSNHSAQETAWQRCRRRAILQTTVHSLLLERTLRDVCVCVCMCVCLGG